MPNNGDRRLDGVIVNFGAANPAGVAAATTRAARVLRIALIVGTVGMADSAGLSAPVLASDAAAPAGTPSPTEAQNRLTELKSAAQALNDIAGRAPRLVAAMFDGSATVRQVLALSAQSDVAQARLETALVAAKAGNALAVGTMQHIDELAAAAKASALPVRTDSKTLEIIVSTAGALGGENFAVRHAPAAKQKEGIASAQQAARDMDALAKAILAATVATPSASTASTPAALAADPPAATPRPEPKPDLQAASQSATAKAATARVDADTTGKAAEAALAKAVLAKKELDGVARTAKRLQDQQAKIAKLKVRIEATGFLDFASKIQLTNSLIDDLNTIANQLTVLAKSPLAVDDRGALTAMASRMQGQIRAMRSEMGNFIPDESRVRNAGTTMEKMAPAIDKLVTGLFAKGAGEAGRLQALAEDVSARAEASRVVADELTIEAQKFERQASASPELLKAKLGQPELVESHVVIESARVASPSGRVPAFAAPELARPLPSPRPVLARNTADTDADGPVVLSTGRATAGPATP